MDTLLLKEDHRRAALALAGRFVTIYEDAVRFGRAGRWHSDAAGAEEIFARDRAAITARVSDLLAEAAPLHSAVRAGRPPRAPHVRILGVDPAAVELQGMTLADEGLRARVARLDDLGTPYETPEDTAGDPAWTAGDRAPAVHLWLEDEIDQTVRLWTGAWETSVDSAQHRVLLGLGAIAATHAEQIEADLRARCPDPWLHSVAGAVGRMFRRCKIVNDTFPWGAASRRARARMCCVHRCSTRSSRPRPGEPKRPPNSPASRLPPTRGAPAHARVRRWAPTRCWKRYMRRCLRGRARSSPRGSRTAHGPCPPAAWWPEDRETTRMQGTPASASITRGTCAFVPRTATRRR